ncbi:MAG TPA: ATP-binding protein [Gemmatimonadaceae bacterium]|nr:ATP-binding protein [Gemmatimonadaceae bacterium]
MTDHTASPAPSSGAPAPGRAGATLSVEHAQQLEAIATLAGGLAHDVNNLLSIVQGYAELLAEQLADRPAGLELLGEVLEAVQRTGTLTRHLLAFSRRQVLRPRAIAVPALLSPMVDVLRSVLGDRVTLTVECADDTPWIRVDRVQFEQALVHLTTNAREAMPAGGRVAITARATAEGRAELSLRDTGVGIPLDVQPRVFEPFFTTKPQRRGTGLGLSAVLGIVQQHGGTLSLTSAPGAGTTITITLPSVPAPVDAPPVPVLAPLPVARNQRVLVVEDEAVFGLLMRRLLSDLGYRVMLAGGLSDAVAQLEAAPEPVDLVITDVIMPGGSGLDLAARLAVSHPTLPVLFMSGYDAEQLPQRSDADEMPRAILQKPFTQDELDRAVRAALRPDVSGS